MRRAQARRALAALLLLAASAFAQETDSTQIAPETPPWREIAAKARHTFSGIQYVVLEEGAGEKPVRNQVVQMHYVGRLADGRVFDSSYKRGHPFHFKAGIGYVIAGWDEMALDMRKGERRVVVIPPELAYGRQGVPGEIPQNATLTFDMTLVDF